MKKLFFPVFAGIFFLSVNISAQTAGVAINDDGASPNPSAKLDVQSVTGGILIPRMSTTQMENIYEPATGLMIYNLETKTFWYWDLLWKEIIVEESGQFCIVSVNIPEIGNGEHWEIILNVPGVTQNTGIVSNAIDDLDDPDGDILISSRVLGANQVVLKFSNNSNHKNDARTCLVNLHLLN